MQRAMPWRRRWPEALHARATPASLRPLQARQPLPRESPATDWTPVAGPAIRLAWGHDDALRPRRAPIWRQVTCLRAALRHRPLHHRMPRRLCRAQFPLKLPATECGKPAWALSPHAHAPMARIRNMYRFRLPVPRRLQPAITTPSPHAPSLPTAPRNRVPPCRPAPACWPVVGVAAFHLPRKVKTYAHPQRI